MKIAVFGTPQIAADIFDEIVLLPEITIAAAVTVPDRPAGRGKKLQPTPVKEWAEQKGIPVYQPEKPLPELGELLKESGIELFLVISYGKIFSRAFLEASPPAWNLHFSLLPEFRGASPVQSAILAGKDISGVTVFKIGPGMDDGPILAQKELSIAELRADRVFAAMHDAGTDLLAELLRQKAEGRDMAITMQADGNASYCKKITKTDGILDPHSEQADEALKKIRAFHPWPGTSVERNGRRLKILDARMADKKLLAGKYNLEDNRLLLGFTDGTLELTQVQPEGKRPMSGADFGRGQQWE